LVSSLEETNAYDFIHALASNPKAAPKLALMLEAIGQEDKDYAQRQWNSALPSSGAIAR
jgi:hypothetical protein